MLFVKSKFWGILIVFVLLIGCKQSEENLIPASHESMHQQSRELTQEFKEYWYSGLAEITSYSLKQERYGELRDGTAVNIFVTEDFLSDEQVKANSPGAHTTSVLKSNQVKKFVTGIYPYSIMTSTFNPIPENRHALKSTLSMQEWCGQVYMQLNNRKKFELQLHSYFEGEADQEFSLDKCWLENELWNLIRINPNALPTGEFEIIPSFEYARMWHQKIAPHVGHGSLMQGDSISTYTLTYPEQQRELVIYFESAFPYGIERWTETYANGAQTEAVKLQRIRSAYWNQNDPKFEFLRDSLQL